MMRYQQKNRTQIQEQIYFSGHNYQKKHFIEIVQTVFNPCYKENPLSVLFLFVW